MMPPPFRRDHAAGGLCVAIGLGTLWEANQYHIGTLNRMGPGFYPAALGALMVLMGVLIAAYAGEVEAEDPLHAYPERTDWRGWICIIAGMTLFLVLDKFLGLVAAAFSCIFVSALGDRQATLLSSAALAAAMTVFGAVLFRWILRVNLPLW